MPNDNADKLIATPDHTDPGDEIFRRFRYQAAYAATLALDLLQDDGQIVEVYCEHHEDILVRLRSGKLRGIQVKTRGDGAPHLRATDDAILDALSRFVELELRFADAFDSFELATNLAFDRSGKGHGNLHTVTAEAKASAADRTKACDKARRLAQTLVDRFVARAKAFERSKAAKAKALATAAKKLAKAAKSTSKKRLAQQTTTIGDAVTEAPSEQIVETAESPPPDPPAVTIDDVLRVFAKLDLQDGLPKLPDMRERIRGRLIKLSARVRGSTISAAERVVDELEHASFLAASRADEDRNGRLWFVVDTAARAELASADQVRAKCLNRAIVEAAINRHCAGPLLVTTDEVKTGDIPTDLSLVERKLALGGLSAGTVSVARDAVASVEEFGTQLLYVHDVKEGARRVAHARAIAKKEASLAYETQAATGHVSGPKMLGDVEERLRRRRQDDETGVLQEFQEEHLLGHVFALTGECIVWWSTSRDLGVSVDTSAPAPEPSDE